MQFGNAGEKNMPGSNRIKIKLTMVGFIASVIGFVSLQIAFHGGIQAWQRFVAGMSIND